MKEFDLCVSITAKEKTEILSKAISYGIDKKGKIYNKNDVVCFEGNYYMSMKDDNNEAPGLATSTIWKKIIFQS